MGISLVIDESDDARCVKFVASYLGVSLPLGGSGPMRMKVEKSLIQEVNTILRYVAQVAQWMSFSNIHLRGEPSALKNSVSSVNDVLSTRTYFVGDRVTMADLVMFYRLHPVLAKMSDAELRKISSVSRWADQIQHSAGILGKSTTPALLSLPKVSPYVLCDELLGGAGAQSKPSATQNKGQEKSNDAKEKKGEQSNKAGDKKQEKQEKRGKQEKQDKAQEKNDKKDKKDKKEKKKGGNDAAQAKNAPIGDIDVSKLDLRIGRIVKAWPHEESEKLYCEVIDIGEEQPREIGSGLRQFYASASELENRLVVVVANLAPRPMGGFKSHGMVLCASNEDHTQVEFVDPPAGSQVGERVTFDGFEGEPATHQQIKKKKIMEKVFPDLTTSAAKVCMYKGSAFRTSAGVCTVPNLANAHIN